MEGTSRPHSATVDIPDFLIKTAMGCSLVVIFILIPFTINNFIQGRLIMCLATLLVAIACSFNIWLGFHGRYSLLVNIWLVTPSGILAIVYAFLKLGHSASYWPFLLALSSYFILPIKRARYTNIVICLITIPVAWMILDQSSAVRFSASILGVSLFAYFSMREINILHKRFKKQRDYLQNVFANSADAIAIVDKNGKFIEWNRSAERLYGFSSEDLKGAPFSFVYPDKEKMEKMLQKLRTNSFIRGYEIDMKGKDGLNTPYELSISLLKDESGENIGSVCVARDLTQKKKTEAELKRRGDILEELADLDGLTGIANRRKFDQFLDAECSRSSRFKHPVSLIMIDIDYFKRYNDYYGHTSGDEVLKNVAAVLTFAIPRKEDLAARYGGEEFACILPETDNKGAITVAGRILEGIRSLEIPHERSDVADHLTASIGIATAKPDSTRGDRPLDLIKLADKALYQAKSNGRNQTVNLSVQE